MARRKWVIVFFALSAFVGLAIPQRPLAVLVAVSLVILSLLFTLGPEHGLLGSYMLIVIALNVKEAARLHEALAVNAIWIVSAGYAGCCMVRYGLRALHKTNPLTVTDLLLLAYILWGLAVSLVVGDVGMALERVCSLVMVYVLFFRCFRLVIKGVLARNTVEDLVRIISGGFWLSGLLTLVYVMYRPDQAAIPAVVPWVKPFNRAQGIFGTPNALGMNMAVGMGWSLTGLWLAQRFRWKIALVTGLAICGTAVFLTNSRASIFYAFTYAIVAGLGYYGSRRATVKLVYGMIVSVALGLYLRYLPDLSVLKDYISRGQADVLVDRRALIRLSYDLATERPLGYGWGCLPPLNMPIDNAYVVVLLETGWPGLLLYASFLCSMLLKAVDVSRKVSKYDRMYRVSWSCTGLIAAGIVHGAFESSISSPLVMVTQSVLVAWLLVQGLTRVSEKR